jgi:hypothetical protein
VFDFAHQNPATGGFPGAKNRKNEAVNLNGQFVRKYLCYEKCIEHSKKN